MQAVVIQKFGDPRDLLVTKMPTPRPEAGEALVEVRAASINPSDILNVRGAMSHTTLPRISGLPLPISLSHIVVMR